MDKMNQEEFNLMNEEQPDYTMYDTSYHPTQQPDLNIHSSILNNSDIMLDNHYNIIFHSIYDQQQTQQEEPHVYQAGYAILNDEHRKSLPLINANTANINYLNQRRYTESIIPDKRTIKRQRLTSSTEESEDAEESKRKQFLERNRKAALKCRQRKKQWLNELQHKITFLSTDNDQLESQASELKEEVLSLKTLLLAHVDCKVAQANGTTASVIQSVSNVNTTLLNNIHHPHHFT